MFPRLAKIRDFCKDGLAIECNGYGRHQLALEKLGRNIILASFVILALIYATRFPNHFSDGSWGPHAKTHLLAQISTGIAFSFIGVLLSLKMLETGRRSTWLILLVLWLFQFGGYWIGKFSFEADAAWRSGNTVFAVLTALYLVGLLMTLRCCLADDQEAD